ncbi:MAG: hypothetical protein KDA51_17620, partial [Planctomycetales bacterium]|nr:hypothetical protein [Planctomycetales bacterium]
IVEAPNMRLICELRQLLRAWQKQDRIRAASGIGSLLNLEPGRRLLVRQAIYLISGRSMTTSGTALEVTYALDELDREPAAQFRVSLELARPTHGRLTFTRDSSTMELFYEDVSVLAGNTVATVARR